MKELKNKALKVSFIPILNLISIPLEKVQPMQGGHFYFKSAYVCPIKVNTLSYRSKKLRRLLNLMEKLKEETAKIKDIEFIPLIFKIMLKNI